uniref:RNase H type-1 domain-containing protein n=1 Tax=Pectinophora gossypiella TaxID=13191 RepID=A0A1E1WRT6_PECGO
MISHKVWSTFKLQSIVGWLNFVSFVVSYGRLHFRNLLNLMRQSVREQVPIPATEAGRADLLWWKTHYNDMSDIWPPPVTQFIVSDASDLGWGAYVNGYHIKGTWTDCEKLLSTNMKELLTIHFILKEFAPHCRGETVLIQSDNRTALAYLRNQGGTRSDNLMSLTRSIFAYIVKYRIRLTLSYIPGPLNTIADSLSRFEKLPEWHLIPTACNVLFTKWGTPCIDLFASHSAHVVPLYVSRDLRDPHAVHYDAFSRDWSYSLAWVFPPPCLMPQVLLALNQARGRFIIICPQWSNVPWRADLKPRALSSPYTIRHLHRSLIDTRTGLPPPQVDKLKLEAWLVQGGMTYYRTGHPRRDLL